MEALQVGLMLSPQLITVQANTDIAAALQLMQQEKSSCIVIVSPDHKPLGIFTEHDLIHQLARHQNGLQGPVHDFARPSVNVPREMHRNEAFICMSEHQISHLAVVDEQGYLQGVVSNKDFTDYFLHLPIAISLTVKDVMSCNVRCLPAGASLRQALSLMDNAHISCIVVEEDGKACGILTERDLVQLALDKHNMAQIPLQEVMHAPVQTLDQNSLILSALQQMKHRGIRRFVVTDHQGCIAGLITQHDISRAIQMNYVDYLETELQRKEKAYQSIQRQLKAVDQPTLMNLLLEQTRDGILLLAADSLNILSLNQQACQQLGYSREELIGKPVSGILPDDTLQHLQHFNRLSRQSPAVLFQTCYRHKSGRQLPVEVNTSLVTLGNTDYLVASARDISERLRIESYLTEREETYRSVVETALDGFWIVSRNGQLLEVNPAYCRMTGYSREQLLQTPLSDIEHPDSPGLYPRLEQLIHQQSARFESSHIGLMGERIDVEVSSYFWPGQGGRFFVHIKDIRQQKRDELRLKQAAAVFENTGEAVMIVSARRKIQRVNKAFCQMTGFREQDVLGRSPALLQSGAHDRRFYKAMWHSIRTYGHWQGEITNRRADGNCYPELLNISVVRDNNGRISHYVGVFADLSQQRESENRLLFLDYHDTLTGLANRKNLMTRTDHAIRHARRDKQQVALMVIGLDRFKNVNDSYGHNSGDELLRLIGNSIDEQVPQADTVCRLGGDEFALLFDDLTDSNQLVGIANNLIRRLSQPWQLSDNRVVKLGASMGISLAPRNGNDAQTLLQHADAALYQAKAEGRSRFRFFSDELTLNARHRLELETRMHQALQQGELEVYYQPQVDIHSQRIIGAEALVRWNHPEKGMIPPGDFIPQCEENGLINGIGLTVLEQTCRQGRAWLDAGFEPIILAVNLSAVQLGHPDIYVHITRILLETGFPPQYLELELTESALMGNPEQMLKRLQQFKDIGIKLAMDDFGTGYSSFTQLKQLPLDLLKIDKSFIDDLSSNQDDYAIVAAIVAMGQALGLKVLAEGVEDPAQFHALADLKCDRYQGYLLSKPLPAEQFSALWQSHQVEHSHNFVI